MNKKLSGIGIFNIVFFAVILVLDLIYMNASQNVSEYITKGAVTGAFVVCGIVNLIYVIKHKESPSYKPLFKYLMMLGLFFLSSSVSLEVRMKKYGRKYIYISLPRLSCNIPQTPKVLLTVGAWWPAPCHGMF